MTMKTINTLMLAAVAALSFGAGAAMAQDGSGFGGPDYWSRATNDAAIRAAANPDSNNQLLFGSPDVQSTEAGAAHSSEYIFNHHLYGAGGVGG
jgi:hypothetical protein